MVNRRNVVIAAALAVALVGGGVAVQAATSNPTQSDAQSALGVLQQFVANHPDPTAAPTSTPTPSVTPTPSPSPTPTPTSGATTNVYRLVAGNGSVKDGAGNTWTSDAAYVVGSTTGIYAVTAPISGTTDDALFQTERWENTGYRFPVSAGTYRVTINEAELYFNSAGSRVFDIKTEGQTVVSNLDIFAKAGGANAATTVTFDVPVSDGALDLAYADHADDGKIDSIKIDRLGSDATPIPTASATPTPNPTPAPSTSNPAPVVAGGLRSGLAWNSGAGTGSYQNFEAFRNDTPLDVWDTWDNQNDWGTIESLPTVAQYSSFAGMMAFAMPPIPDSGATLDECATNGDAAHYSNVANGLKKAGWGGTAAKPTFIRFGWEASGDWYAWGVGRGANGNVQQAEAKFVGCWKSAYTAFKAVSPYFKFDFNVGSAQGRLASDMYPGDSYVDVVGTDWYDSYPAKQDTATFNSTCNMGTATQPIGPCQFAAFARAHGKGFSVPEWGLDVQNSKDDPVFIQGMHDLFANNVDLMAGTKGYEAYFDLQGCNFQLTGGCNANSAAKYVQLFSA